MSQCVVVGGGVVGLLASIVASRTHDRTFLIEKDTRCGGLLGSFERKGAVYDYGTHIPGPTGIDELDAILYGPPGVREREYHAFHFLRSENYHHRRWYKTSPLIDARTLPQDVYLKGVNELLLAPGAEAGERNLGRYLQATFGPTFSDQIYRPVLRKLVSEEIESLDRDILRVFGLERLIVLDPDVSKDLKTIRRYDASVGFHSYEQGAATIPYIYPKGNRGIGFWPQHLETQARTAGVEILTGESIRNIGHARGTATHVELSDGKRIAVDRILWSIPPALACRAAGLEVGGVRPKFCSHTLVHLRYERPLLKAVPQYLLVWDPGMRSYRITLYPNITPDRRAAQMYHLSVEVLGNSGPEDLAATIRTVERELAEMEVVDADNPVIDRHGEFLGPSFPVLTPGFREVSQTQAAALAGAMGNLVLLGRGGEAFFINDLLRQAWRKLQELH